MTADPTPLDLAHAAMEAAPGDDALRLRYYERLADGELFLLLQEEPDGDTLSPQVYDLTDGPVVLAFDREERLAEFAGEIVPYAALPGRVMAAMLAGQGVGLGVNLGAASAMILPTYALDWLAQTLDSAPETVEAMPDQFTAPVGVPEVLVAALNEKLARAGGLASSVLLAGVTYDDGRRGHMLAFVDAVQGAEQALARAAAEALVFSGLDAGEMDVTFLDSNAPATQSMANVALRFDLPQPEAQQSTSPAAPGSNPDRPPILR